MAGKRSATSDLNHENWDRDEDPEESGTFQRASDDSLKRRIIKTAKRRNPISPVKDNGDKKSAFTSFSGFGKPDTPTSSAFSFLSNLTKSNGIDDKQNETKYYEKLKGLNQSVSIWIKNHVDANPLINLQPIFKDYEKYFDELEIEKNLKPVLDNNKTDSMSTFLFKSTTNVPDSTSEKTQKIGPDTDKKIENIIPKFSFGTSVTSTGNTPTPTFSFGNKTGSGSFSFGTTTKDVTNTTTTSSFTFGNNTSTVSSFTFGNIAKPDTDKEKEEEDEPPVNNFTPVIEKDHIYTIRCKVFIKKNDKFGDRGVGNLFLKPIKDSEKFQLIIRADTNLGNLLLNCILSENIPVKRLGNKDVMLVCVPTPESTPLGSPQPVPVLLRVKNPEEADALLEVLEKHKK